MRKKQELLNVNYLPLPVLPDEGGAFSLLLATELLSLGISLNGC